MNTFLVFWSLEAMPAQIYLCNRATICIYIHIHSKTSFQRRIREKGEPKCPRKKESIVEGATGNINNAHFQDTSARWAMVMVKVSLHIYTCMHIYYQLYAYILLLYINIHISIHISIQVFIFLHFFFIFIHFWLAWSPIAYVYFRNVDNLFMIIMCLHMY